MQTYRTSELRRVQHYTKGSSQEKDAEEDDWRGGITQRSVQPSPRKAGRAGG